jgi:hypothetical protein
MVMLSQALAMRADWREKMKLLVSVSATLRSRGPRGLAEYLYQEIIDERIGATVTSGYAGWLQKFDMQVPGDIDDRIEALERKPLISIVMPTYNTPERWLRKCIESVRQQAYPYWELCIADDASTKHHVRQVLSEYERIDPRIKVAYLDIEEQGGSSVNGLAIPANEGRLAELDLREVNYSRIDVSAAFRPRIPHRVFTYVGTDAARERSRRETPDAGVHVSRQYVERIRQAFAALGPDALAEYERTTEPLPFRERDLELRYPAPSA